MKITPRVALTLTFMAFGAFIGSQTGAIPVLKQQSGVDSFVFGIVAGFSTLAIIVAMSLGGIIARRFDHRSVLLFILPVAYAALAFNLSVQSIASFALSFILLSLCTGTNDLFMNAEAAVVEHHARRPMFSTFHAAALLSVGFFGLVSGFIAVNFGPLWALLPAFPVVVAAIAAINHAIPPTPPHLDGEKKSAAPLPRKLLILIGIIIGLDVAAELTCVQWSGQLLAELRPSLAAYSGLGIAFYGLFDGGIRLFGDRIRNHVSDLTIVAVSLFISMLGFITLALDPGFAISVVAFAVTGHGLGLIFPCLFSVAAKLAPDARASALGLVSFVSGPPRIILPFFLGFIAQTYGMSTIYMVSVAAMAIGLGFTYWVSLEIAKRKEAQVSLRPSTQSVN
jgi:hypothetical protein